jgi:non-canonical (house-cleaning) NTP pyrophosphatase
MFAVEPNVPRMNLLDTPPETMTSLLEVKPQAAVSDLGFYSAAEQAALNLQRNKGSGQAFLNDLLKAENVKKDELQWMGVDDFLKEKPNVTKQEVQDFITNNRVDVKEVQLGSKGENPYPYSTADEWQSAINRAERSRDFDEAERLTSAWEAYEGLGSQTKYQKYTLPGGENYREILMTLPTRGKSELDIAQETAGNLRRQTSDLMEQWKSASELMPGDPSVVALYEKVAESRRMRDRAETTAQALKDQIRSQTYTSSHFDEPNILAHIRVNDRVDADGKKMLLIEEIQSDWHQAGREKGYKTGKERNPADVEKELTVTTQKRSRLIDEAAALPDSEMTKFIAMNEEIKALSEQAKKLDEEWTNLLNKPQGVPDAPFKDTWYQLALKRVLKHAADNGYERVGLTTGKQQAERFDLSKQVDELLYKKNEDGTYQLSAQAGGRGNMMGEAIPENKLSDYVGKELASKITDSVGKDLNLGPNNRPKDMWKSLSDVDLQVGGEGMKKYYDEIYPKFLDKYGKKWNARVGETRIKTGQGIPGGAPVRYIDITPEMKGAVSKGQPLFAAAPALPLGAQGLLGEPEKKKELSLLD